MKREKKNGVSAENKTITQKKIARSEAGSPIHLSHRKGDIWQDPEVLNGFLILFFFFARLINNL